MTAPDYVEYDQSVTYSDVAHFFASYSFDHHFIRSTLTSKLSAKGWSAQNNE